MRLLAFVFLAIFLPFAAVADDVLICQDERSGVTFELADGEPRVLSAVNEDLKPVVMKRAEIGFLLFQGQWPSGHGVAIGADLEFYVENEDLGRMEVVGRCRANEVLADRTVPAISLPSDDEPQIPSPGNEPYFGPDGGGGLPGSYKASDGPPPELLAAEARRATRSLPMFVSNNTALDCAARSTNNQDAINCIGRSMLSGRQRAAVECISRGDGSEFSQIVCVAEEVEPGMATALRTYDRCLSGEPDYDCLAADALQSRQYDAYRCVIDGSDVGRCIDAAGIDQNSRWARTVSQCERQSGSATRFAACVLEQDSDNPELARASGCVGKSMDNGSLDPAEVARCYFANELPELDVGLTPEQQIVVQCAIRSGGQPYAFAGCAGGELTVRELSKCVTQGIGNNGCFGPNNEVVKSLNALGVDTGSLLNPNGEVIKVWNTASRDLVAPGPNNDVVRTLGELEGVIDNVGAEAQRVGSTVEDAVENLEEEAEKFYEDNLDITNLL